MKSFISGCGGSGPPPYFTEVQKRTTALEEKFNLVMGAGSAKVLELRPHPVVDDSLSEVLKALVANERAVPYRFSKE